MRRSTSQNEFTNSSSSDTASKKLKTTHPNPPLATQSPLLSSTTTASSPQRTLSLPNTISSTSTVQSITSATSSTSASVAQSTAATTLPQATQRDITSSTTVAPFRFPARRPWSPMVSDWFEQGKTPIWHHTDQRHLDQATEQIGDLKLTIESLKADLAASETREETLRDQLHNERLAKQEVVQGLQGEVETLTKRTVEQDDVIANDQDKIDELKVEINDLWEELDFANHKLDLAEESHAELSKELKDQEGAEELLKKTKCTRNCFPLRKNNWYW